MEGSVNQPDQSTPARPLEAASPAPASSLVAIHVDYDRRVNYASQQKDVAIIKLLRIENLDWNDLSDLTGRVAIASALAQPWGRPMARLASFGTVRIGT